MAAAGLPVGEITGSPASTGPRDTGPGTEPQWGSGSESAWRQAAWGDPGPALVGLAVGMALKLERMMDLPVSIIYPEV